uniref:MIA SH3 domain ER export factor 3 n=1 Tax=Scleropages formosus TaxID=113540 RepID=A0A8D0CM82_SCLFO
ERNVANNCFVSFSTVLLCRGKASQDFTGPDCRFLTLKKGETIYVYYKLSGRRPDLWAGSIGNTFGYFPKDLLEINHIYTDKEVEVPAEETDFVCFDTGLDKFESYDLDALLAAAALLTKNDGSDVEINADVEELASELSRNENDHRMKEDLQSVNNDPVKTSVSKTDLEEKEGKDLGDWGTEDSTQILSQEQNEPLDTEEMEYETQAELLIESKKDDMNGDQLTGSTVSDVAEPEKDRAHTASSDKHKTILTIDSVDVQKEKTFSEGNVVPELKTKFGSTFDAVTSDDIDTWHVTPSNEVEKKEMENQSVNNDPVNDETTTLKETPLLSFSEDNNFLSEPKDISKASHSVEESDFRTVLTENQEDKGVEVDEAVGTSLSDTVFAVDDEEEATAATTLEEEDGEKDFQLEMSENDERAKEENVQLLASDFNQEHKETTHTDKHPPDDSISDEHSEPNINDPENDVSSISSQKPLLEEIPDKAELKVVETFDKTSNQLELSVPGTDTENSEHLDEHEGDSSQKTMSEQLSEKFSAGNGIVDLEISKVTVEASDNHLTEQDLDTAEKASVTPTLTHSKPSELQDEQLSGNASDPNLDIAPDVEMKTDNYKTENETKFREVFDSKEDTTDQEELLLEDENAMLSKVSKVEHLEPHKDINIGHKNEIVSVNSNEVVSSSSDAKSTEKHTEELDVQNELQYDDCEKQLLLLRSHVEVHDLKRFYKYLGPQNLLTVEAMFSDLDQEMRVTKLSHAGTNEEIQQSLESILEASETSILDEIEKMLDTRELKDTNLQEIDGTFLDEEAAILDDFQELAFQLRQKYSTASESTPLASEDPLHTDSENLTVTTTGDAEPAKNVEELQNDSLGSNPGTPHHGTERNFEEDGGHFNKNKDIQGTFKESEDIQRSPQAILENPLDMGFGFEVENPSTGSMDSAGISDYQEEEPQIDSSTSDILPSDSSWILAQEYLGVYAEMVIAALPEEWKPGPTFYGFPWEPVVVTAVVGIFTILVFTWRTVLAVMTEKQLSDHIKKLSDEKGDALTRISQLKKKVSRVQILLDEARIREEALKVQLMSFEKENNSLKEQKKSLLCDAKNWEEKYQNLSEKIKIFQRAQKELEDTLAHKENEIELCPGTENLFCGSFEFIMCFLLLFKDKKSDAMKIRIKQMMDVSRVKATLSIVEEERNTYLAKLLTEEKQRHELEEQIKKMEHDRASLNSEKCQLENQFKTIQQKLEIMNEMYQQKENALQQKLSQEKFERLEKENKLSEVDGKALQAEEELKAYKRRIQEIEDELQKTERSYKAQIAAHEKKAHENWLNARAAERALVEEKRETANLRQKLVEVSDKLAEFQRPLFKPTPSRSDRQMQPLRRDDSYGPSPVSGGAPSPPLMIEGPGRSPSAPVGRRNEPFGPRPPSDPHGRYSDLGHPLPARSGIFILIYMIPKYCITFPIDAYAPRTSSPNTPDGSVSNPPAPPFLTTHSRGYQSFSNFCIESILKSQKFNT